MMESPSDGNANTTVDNNAAMMQSTVDSNDLDAANSNDGGLPNAAIIGIGIAGVAVLGLSAIVVIVLVKRRGSGTHGKNKPINAVYSVSPQAYSEASLTIETAAADTEMSPTVGQYAPAPAQPQQVQGHLYQNMAIANANYSSARYDPAPQASIRYDPAPAESESYGHGNLQQQPGPQRDLYVPPPSLRESTQYGV